LPEIRRIRLERAKPLLQETSLDIPSVAEASGFALPEYFTFYHGAKVGMSPLQFRKHSNPSGRAPRSSPQTGSLSVRQLVAAQGANFLGREG
jgi:AraC-like DNA-binding protein